MGRRSCDRQKSARRQCGAPVRLLNLCTYRGDNHAYKIKHVSIYSLQHAVKKTLKHLLCGAAGGNVDLVSRAVAEPLSKALGQQVIVENRPGASSLVGTMMVANASANGYTLLAHSTTFVTAPLLL